MERLIRRLIVVAFISIIIMQTFIGTGLTYAMPFYDLQPQNLTLRAKFFTTYSSSSAERKTNIALASKSLNNVMVDVNGEFSFNLTVGERTERRGYKKAKIIVGGEFVDGVGGGVCQVSTTLYNAILLAGLNIIECHPHSLPVNYVAPSFDAMVNSGWADLKFVNDTHNPILIKSCADGNTLKIEIYGEPMKEVYERKSILIEEIPSPKEEIIFDENGEYPDLFEGEFMFLKYGRAGYKSEGYLVISENGKIKSTKKIRSDKYKATRGLIIYGRALKPIQDEKIDGTKKIEERDKKNFQNIKNTLTNNFFYDNII